MRFLHTSDWHLGRSFHQVGLLPAQAQFLDHLVETVRAERVDAVLVSGDIYDRALPAPDAVALLDETLLRLVDSGAQVVLSSGNHDSAVRLGFASGLLERAGLHVRTGLADLTRPVLIGDVRVHPIPYLEPLVVADELGATERTHAGVLRAAVERIEATSPVGAPRVVMAHAFVGAGVGTESERDIAVGGVSAVSTAVFEGFTYAALGHLHGCQQVAPGQHYSGSPVAMSFGEAGHRKGSLLVDVADQQAVVTRVEAPVLRPLAVLSGDLDDLLGQARYASAESAWCQVTLTDPVRPLAAMDRIRRRFPHTLELRFAPRGGAPALRSYAARVQAPSPQEVCCAFLEHVRGGHPATVQERALLGQAIESSRVEHAVRSDEGLARIAGVA